MLVELNIKNFALIQELSVEFGAGFNILSGETGAGKSILIDTIDYVLGGKFSKDQIRYGEDKTMVEAVFSIENDEIYEVLDDLSIEKDDMLIIPIDPPGLQAITTSGLKIYANPSNSPINKNGESMR